MTLRSQQSVFAKNIGLLIAYAYANGFELTFGEVYRTVEQQEIYFKTGRSKTMNSRHIQRMAVDFNIFINGRMLFADPKIYDDDLKRATVLADYWESLNVNNVWGSNWDKNKLTKDKFQDPYHFEMKPM